MKDMIAAAEKGNRLFYASFLLILLYIFLRFPSLSYRAEAFAETGWLFFDSARGQNALDTIFQLEVGYLPFFQNIISLIVVKVLRIVDYYPYWMQGISAVSIAFFSSLINLKAFRPAINDDLTRFVAGLVIGIGVFTEYELYTFINFTYFGLVYALLIIYMDIEKMKWWAYAPALFLSVITLTSKPHFAAFLPVYLVLCVERFRRKKYK